MSVLYITSDLFFSSRVSSLARDRGITIDVAAPAAAAEKMSAGVQLVLIDLAQRSLDVTAAVEMVRAQSSDAAIVAYGPHVDAETLAAARDAGCDQVLPRSQFDQQIGAILDLLPQDGAGA